MSDFAFGLVSFPALLVLIFLRVPIGLAMLVTGLVGVLIMTGDPVIAFGRLRSETYPIFSSYSLSIVPMFLLMGHFATLGGMSQALFKSAASWLGRRKGGVAMSAVGACAGFGAICGSSLATAATMSRVALPELKRYGYSGGFSTATLAAGGTLGILIPPSVVLVIYAILTEQNIAKLFLAAFIPGALAALGYMLAVSFYTWRHDPEDDRTAAGFAFDQIGKGLAPAVILVLTWAHLEGHLSGLALQAAGLATIALATVAYTGLTSETLRRFAGYVIFFELVLAVVSPGSTLQMASALVTASLGWGGTLFYGLLAFGLGLGSLAAFGSLTRERVMALVNIWPVLLVFFLVVGGIYLGWFTPTEGAAIGALGTGIIALAAGGLTWATLGESFYVTAKSTAMIFFIVLGAAFYNGFLALTQLPQEAALWVGESGLNPWVILALILVLYLILGCFMDSLSMILLTIPIFWPMVQELDFGLVTMVELQTAKLDALIASGMDIPQALLAEAQALLASGQEIGREMARELGLRGVSKGALARANIEQTAIWFGILVLIVVEVGLITPPVGMNLFVINAMDKETPMVETYKAVLYFVATDLFRVALLLAFPIITLMLIPL